MKTLSLTAVAGLCLFSVAPAWAQDLTPPKVAKPLPDITVGAAKKQTVIDLTDTFKLEGVTGQIVRMATVVGNIDIEMLAKDAPKNVANFLSYVNSGAYNMSFINRSDPGFVIQGGGYAVKGGQIEAVPENAPVVGEHLVSNTIGTIAFALQGGGNSADTGTNQWFFNLANNNGTTPDNPNLDTFNHNQGPFTVFGRVIEADLANVNAIAALPIQDLSEELGDDNFEYVPVYDFTPGGSVTFSNLVYLNTVAVITLVPTSPGVESVLTLSAKSKKPDLVTASISGNELKLVYKAKKTGTALIKVVAKDSAGTSVNLDFTVTIK